MELNTADIRRRLVALRAELAARLERIRRDSVHRDAPLAADSADRAQEQENDEVLYRLSEATESMLAQCSRAIARLDAGRYGTCEVCGFSIEPERIKARPEATRCAPCTAAVAEVRG